MKNIDSNNDAIHVGDIKIRQNTILMAKEYLRRLNMKHGLAIILIALCMSGCTGGQQGPQLHRFVIVDKVVEKTARMVIEWYHRGKIPNERVILMNLSYSEETGKSIHFSIQERCDFLDHYMLYHNRRIVGFVSIDGEDIIVVSDIDYRLTLTKTYEKVLYPLKEKRRFADLDGYAVDQYYDDKWQKGQEWSSLPQLYDPSFIVIKDSAGVWSSPVLTTYPEGV